MSSSFPDPGPERRALDEVLLSKLLTFHDVTFRPQKPDWEGEAALDGFAALALFARAHETDENSTRYYIRLKTVEKLCPLVEREPTRILTTKLRWQQYEDVRIQTTRHSSSWKAECVSIALNFTLYTQVQTASVQTVHPSAILHRTLERINSVHEPKDVDLQLLVAIYRLEVDSKTVLKAGIFIDPTRIKDILSQRSQSHEAFEETLADVAGILEASELKDRIRDIAKHTFGSSAAAAVVEGLLQTIKKLLHEAPIVHPGTPVNWNSAV
ncbi:hypothetical protein JCM16303_000477 [Sporobolomyces ruberrimus]